MTEEERAGKIAAKGFDNMTALKKSEHFAIFIAAQQAEADEMQRQILNDEMPTEEREKMRQRWKERVKIIGWVDEMLVIHERALPDK